MNFEYYINRLVRDISSIAHSMDASHWTVLSVVTCVAGYFLLKGSNLRG